MSTVAVESVGVVLALPGVLDTMPVDPQTLARLACDPSVQVSAVARKAVLFARASDHYRAAASAASGDQAPRLRALCQHHSAVARSLLEVARALRLEGLGPHALIAATSPRPDPTKGSTPMTHRPRMVRSSRAAHRYPSLLVTAGCSCGWTASTAVRRRSAAAQYRAHLLAAGVPARRAALLV